MSMYSVGFICMLCSGEDLYVYMIGDCRDLEIYVSV